MQFLYLIPFHSSLLFLLLVHALGVSFGVGPSVQVLDQFHGGMHLNRGLVARQPGAMCLDIMVLILDDIMDMWTGAGPVWSLNFSWRMRAHAAWGT